MSEFDEDTEVSADGEVTLAGRWNGMGGLINGGYEVAICLKALARLMPYPDPVVVSGLYLRPGRPGPASVRTELLRAGLSTAFGSASLMQGGKEAVRATAAFSSLAQNDVAFLASSPPQLPPPDECAGIPPGTPGTPEIAGRIDFRVAEPLGWTRGQPSGNPSVEFWLRFADGRDPDLFSLPLLVDAAPPAVLEFGTKSTATIELTVHLRAHPRPGWLACRAVTRHISGGYHEEDFEAWDSSGTLVAQSRQLCVIKG